MAKAVKRIVCLANSRKLNGRCVAGIELVSGKPAGWIRPVSAREHEEVSEHERQYADGSDPRVLDILDVPLIEARPKAHQQENWLLEPKEYWVRAGRMNWSELAALPVSNGALWIDGHSTYNGRNDKVPMAQASTLTSSLTLVHVDRVRLSVYAPGEAFGNSKRRVQGSFKHAGTEYSLWVTDPVYERRYLAQKDGTYDLGEAFLTISLGEPNPKDNDCYKLIAAIMERE